MPAPLLLQTTQPKSSDSILLGQMLTLAAPEPVENLRFLASPDLAEVAAGLRETTGFFSVVAQTAGTVTVATDHIGSHPLYYSVRGSELTISDRADICAEAAKLTKLDDTACDEFALLGYVTGTDTLVHGLKRVPAGSVMRFTRRGNGYETEMLQHFQFERGVSATATYDSFRAAVSDAAIRLRQHVGDRQVVLPLSGGHDSRLVALMVKEAGLQNVLAYSYGANIDAGECVVSKRVAEALGFEWTFVRYDNDMLGKHFGSDAYNRYIYERSGLSRIPHLQDWPAFSELVQTGRIAPDAVVMPGHGGDILGGQRLPAQLLLGNPINDAATLVFNDNYNLKPLSEAENQNPEEWKARIRTSFGNDGHTALDQINQIGQWTWQERLSKFLVGGVNVYAFHGADWWLPILDRGMVQELLRLPLSGLKNKQAYLGFVNRLYAEHTGDAGLVQNGGVSTTRKWLRSMVLRAFPNTIVKGLKELMVRRQASHFFIAHRTEAEVLPFSKKGYLAQGIMAKFVLSDILKSFQSRGQ